MSTSSAFPVGPPPAIVWLHNQHAALSFAWAGILCLVGLIIYSLTKFKSSYDGIPAVGRTGIFTSYIDAIRVFKDSENVIQEGYDRYHPGVFRIPELNRWHVILAGEKLTEELTMASEDTFSHIEAVRDNVAVDYTFGPNIAIDQYHVAVLRGQLTRNVGNVLAHLREEIALSFERNIPVKEDWTSVQVLSTMMQIVSQSTNRVFIGAPACRDPEFIELNVQFTRDMAVGAIIVGLFPNPLKPLAGRFLTNVPKSINIGLKHLRPIIEERQRKIDEHSPDYPGKPADMLSWLMDEARGEERTAENLTRRILMLNFAAIHTTSMSFTHALFELASRPEYIDPIRREVENALAEHGWSKAAMNRMRKLDSFLKETQRLKTISTLSMTRKALRNYTFSNGTCIPKGALVSATMLSRHKDDAVYPDGSAFKGFRFSELREEEGQGVKNQMVATSLNFLPFGHGKHACPGRFFAVNELKVMMAHVVLTYDVKMTDVAQSTWIGHTMMPDQKAEVMFKKREV